MNYRIKTEKVDKDDAARILADNLIGEVKDITGRFFGYQDRQIIYEKIYCDLTDNNDVNSGDIIKIHNIYYKVLYRGVSPTYGETCRVFHLDPIYPYCKSTL